MILQEKVTIPCTKSGEGGGGYRTMGGGGGGVQDTEKYGSSSSGKQLKESECCGKRLQHEGLAEFGLDVSFVHHRVFLFLFID